MNAQKITIAYDDRTVRRFFNATLFWGAVGMLVGVFIALQLNFHQLNLGEWLTFGRLRPLHTNAVVFAFVGNMMFAGIYYSTQRLCKARMASDLLSSIHFWGWQFIIVCAAVTLPLGLTRGKEYAELIWPINIMVAVVWLVFAANFFLTLKRRHEPSLYVALWFYIATIITVTMLYVVNHLQIPTSLTHSYPIFAGVQDALVQWWYGHNAVAFFLTTPILGIMYYFLPKAAGRPVYSYQLSIVHFWSLVFLYIWAGPHHLLNTSLPFWLQSLGMLFSLMLWAPSWGGMLNGLLTLRGAWDKLRTDPVIKFFVAGVTFYGMATFEGPLLSIRAVNAVSHYTDWTIGHVHCGALGWNGFMAAGMLYWMVPRLWKTRLRSEGLANMHFWISLTGILIYVAAMWIAGITQELSLSEITAQGTLKNEFLKTLQDIHILYLFRAIGGAMYLAGWLLLIINVILSVKGREVQDGSVEVVVDKNNPEMERMNPVGGIISEPVIFCLVGLFGFCLWFLMRDQGLWAYAGLVLGLVTTWRGVVLFKKNMIGWNTWHEKLLHNWAPFSILVFVAAAVGGAVQIIPNVLQSRPKYVTDHLQKLYTPLELAGRDLYVNEGCYNCHSQMIRTLKPDILRYGEASRLGESIYDHPYQWGSKRSGPDLAREGGKRDNLWHYKHLMDPRELSEGSIMPAYPHLKERKTDIAALPKKIAVQRMLNVPYPAMTNDEIMQNALEQGKKISDELKGKGYDVSEESKMVALIAYLQKLGASEEPKKPAGEPEALTQASAK
ncbi:MAG: cytochrome-c oxidase, cbb3-type subunit I [Verrucomicrobiales bacterium]|nr:cytochrome-c oxidase, cbb3-type subunit I [Verrucomicrobiales bacterium]